MVWRLTSDDAFCSRVGRAVVDFSGEEPGSASLLKLVGNTFLLNAIEAVAESHVFAEKTGLGVANLQKLITTLFPIGPYMNYSTRMSSGDYYQKEVSHFEPLCTSNVGV